MKVNFMSKLFKYLPLLIICNAFLTNTVINIDLLPKITHKSEIHLRAEENLLSYAKNKNIIFNKNTLRIFRLTRDTLKINYIISYIYFPIIFKIYSHDITKFNDEIDNIIDIKTDIDLLLADILNLMLTLNEAHTTYVDINTLAVEKKFLYVKRTKKGLKFIDPNNIFFKALEERYVDLYESYDQIYSPIIAIAKNIGITDKEFLENLINIYNYIANPIIKLFR